MPPTVTTSSARVAATGFEPRLLSGEEEAAATFAGVCSHAPGEEPLSLDGTLVVDVGGGSTELVLGAGGGVAWSRSLQAGCVRMTERILGEDVVGVEALAACADAVSALLQVVPDDVVGGDAAASSPVAGTATTLAAIAARRLRPPRRCTAPASRARSCARRSAPGGHDARRAPRGARACSRRARR